MPTNLIVGDTVRIQVTFRDWSSTGNGDIIDPDTVSVDILDQDLVRTPEIEEATKVEEGVYYFDWTPLDTGVFYVEFVGTFGDGTQSVVQEQFEVTKVSEPSSSQGTNLIEDQELVFATVLDPLFADPEEFRVHYVDATTVEIMELVHRYSLEVQKIFKGREPSLTAYEYIRAAVLCALSRIYDYAGGDATSLTLGDLKVSHQMYPRNKITRANAANWCELAAALRQDMIRGEAGMKAANKGTKFPDPMPKRHLRDSYSAKGRRHQ